MKKPFKRGKFYYFYNQNNQRQTTGQVTLKSAKEYIKSTAEMTWVEFGQIVLDYIYNNEYNVKTIDTYERVLRYAEKTFTKPPLDLTPLDFEEYKSKRKGKVKPVTINIELSKLQAMYNIMYKLKIVDNKINVQKVFEPKSQPLSIKDYEMELILGNCPPVIREFVLFAVNTGLRLRELTSLGYENLIEDGVIEVKTKANFKTKCDKYRKVPLNDKAKSVLSVVLLTNINAGWLSRTFKGVLNDLDLNPKYNFHTLRKTFATKCAKKGIFLLDLMAIMGWSDPKMAKIYYEVDLTNARQIVNGF